MVISWRRGLGVLVVAVSVSGLAGCAGTSTAAAPATSAAAAAPEEKRATAAEVTAGLKKIDGIARSIAAAGADKAKATELDKQIEPAWAAVEGTVKANDQNTYLAFEDAFAVLAKASEGGDAAAAAKGASTVSATVATYLAKYPG